jgi:hypothetical protein
MSGALPPPFFTHGPLYLTFRPSRFQSAVLESKVVFWSSVDRRGLPLSETPAKGSRESDRPRLPTKLHDETQFGHLVQPDESRCTAIKSFKAVYMNR